MTEATARFIDIADRAQDWLARYGDPAQVASARQAWKDGTADSPTATFFGAFDCGKSSLLRRLLVDDDLAVPDWLTISARHETFSASGIRYRGVMLHDTPGVDPGALDVRGANNTGIAIDAIRTTDVLLVVVTSQLLTGERELVASVLDQPWPDGSLWFVISRFDEAGVDPHGDLAGYRELAERKGRELADELERTLGRAPSLRVFVAAPDAYGIVGRDQRPDPTMWDSFREWDGMDILADALAGISSSDPALRQATAARFWLAEVHGQCDLLRVRAEDAAGAERTTKELKARLDQFEDRLRELRVSARNDLDAAVGTVIDQALSSAVLADQTLRTRMTDALTLWLERQTADLDSLIQDLDEQLDQQVQRPSWGRFQALLDSLAIDLGVEAVDEPDGRIDPKAHGYKRRLLGINKDLTKATSDLKKRVETGPGGARRSTARSAKGNTSANNTATSARSAAPQSAKSGQSTKANWSASMTGGRILNGLEIATTVGPVLIELGDLVRDYRRDAAQAKEAVRQRARIEARLDELRDSATSVVYHEFATACDALGAQIGERSAEVAAMLAAVAEARELWEAAQREAGELFAAAARLT